MIAALLLASLAASQGSCAGHWTVELRAESFANNGAGKTFSAADLEAFRAKVGDQIKAAFNGACRSGAVNVAAAKTVTRVEVSSASGASDPFIYPSAKGRLSFEWIFAEENLAVPSEEDIIAGATCWTKPDGPACNSPGD